MSNTRTKPDQSPAAEDTPAAANQYEIIRESPDAAFIMVMLSFILASLAKSEAANWMWTLFGAAWVFIGIKRKFFTPT